MKTYKVGMACLMALRSDCFLQVGHFIMTFKRTDVMISHICLASYKCRLILYMPVFLRRHRYVKITRGQSDWWWVNDVPGKYMGGSGRGLVEARYSVFPWTDWEKTTSHLRIAGVMSRIWSESDNRLHQLPRLKINCKTVNTISTSRNLHFVLNRNYIHYLGTMECWNGINNNTV